MSCVLKWVCCIGFGMVSRWKLCQDRDEIRPLLGIKFQVLSILNVYGYRSVKSVPAVSHFRSRFAVCVTFSFNYTFMQLFQY